VLDFMGVLCGGSVLLMGTDTQQAKRVRVVCVLDLVCAGFYGCPMWRVGVANGHGHPTSQAVDWVCIADS
jgi:hypothetical protein